MRIDAFVSAPKPWGQSILRSVRLFYRLVMLCRRRSSFRLLREGGRGGQGPFALALFVVGMPHGPGQTAPVPTDLQATSRTRRLSPTLSLLLGRQERRLSGNCDRTSKVNGRQRYVDSGMRDGYRRRNGSRGSSASGRRLHHKSRCRVGRVPEAGGRGTSDVALGGGHRVADAEGRLLLQTTLALKPAVMAGVLRLQRSMRDSSA